MMESSPIRVSVLLPYPFDTAFTYAHDEVLAPGTFVRVTLGRRDVVGVVWDDVPDFGVKAKLGVPLYQAAAGLGDGGVSAPVVEGGGAHVLVMIHRTPIRPLAFEAARDQVFQDFQRDARVRVERQNLVFLRSRADIRLGSGMPP